MGKVAKLLAGLLMVFGFSQTFVFAKPVTVLTDKNMKSVCTNPSKYIGDKVSVEVSVWLPVYIAHSKLKNTYTALLGVRSSNYPIETWGIVSNLNRNYLSTGDNVMVTGVIVGKVKLNLSDQSQTYVEIKAIHFQKVK